MAHAIGCLGSAVGVYRAEKAKARARVSAKRALRSGPTRNQDRKRQIVLVTHEDGFVKPVLSRVGHVGHVKQAYFYANVQVALTE